MKKIIKIITICLVLSVGVLLFGLSREFAGYRAFIVSSSSMEPVIATGSLIITKYVSPNTLVKNDVITFIAPTKKRDFITHRIVSIKQRGNLAIIKTKGDNNKQPDNWVLAGGGVVGKEILALPLLGYIFSATQTKVGMLGLILVPSLYIVFSEFGVISDLFRKRKVTGVAQSPHLLLGFILLSLISFSPTYALLSDQARLTTNQFTVQPLPNPTQTVTPTQCTTSIADNGAGSINSVSCSSEKSTTVSQSTNTSVINNVHINNNTGGNR